MQTALNRTVRIIESPEADANGKLGIFADYLTVPNIILLGDPGAGKTHTFQAAAKKEDVEFLSVRNFLAFSESEARKTTVYLDGLDEFRSRIKNKNLIIELIKSLRKQGQPRIRLSCRSADWLGESDLSLFKRLFSGLPYVVLNLEPLTDNEILSVLQTKTKNVPNPVAFITKAKSLNLEELLKNPQTLIMLAAVVRQGIWPDTRKELFEKSCKILLTEHNSEHKGIGLGRFSRDELLEPTGEIAASLLISGAPGISILEDVESDEFPYYKTIGSPKKDIIQACLMRRVFSFIDSKKEAVSYIHRTIVEFLAARWLAERIRMGHSILRIQSLIGIDGHPSPELRGLHAWLPVFLPEHSYLFINNDPYGVLKYGDAASLSPSCRKALLSAIVTLSKNDPWFRDGDWSDKLLGPLSGPDMVDSFREILLDPGSSFHLRSIVLGAIANGQQLPQMRDYLIQLMGDREAPHHDRSMAVEALLKVVPDGEKDVIDIFQTKLKSDTASIRLRSKILARLCETTFELADVLSVFQDILHDTEEHAVNELWDLTYSLPEAALPEILDTLDALNSGEKLDGKWVNHFVVKSAYTRLLLRVLESDLTIQVGQLWQWLKTLYILRNKDGTEDDIAAWLKQHQEFIFDMLLYAYEEKRQKNNWAFWHEFHQITMYSLLLDENLISKVFAQLSLQVRLSEVDCFLYEKCGLHLFLTEPQTARYLLEDFLTLAMKHPQLQLMCQEACQCKIEDWRFESIERNLERKHEQEKERAQTRANLENTKESIAAGKHLQNLGFLAKVYFGKLPDIDRSLSPTERLREITGDKHLAPALAGFAAVLERDDLPTPCDVALSFAENRYWPWWHAILAGVNEVWLQREKSLGQFSDHLLESALALAIELPANTDEDEDRKWQKQLLKERSDIVESVYEDIAVVNLKLGRSNITVLYYLEHREETKPWRGKVALRLLRLFPCTSTGHLSSLVLAGLYDPECHDELLKMAEHGVVSCSGEQKAIWIVVAFLLDYKKFSKLLDVYSKTRDEVIWILRNISQHTVKHHKGQPAQLSIEQMESIIFITGRQFKNVSSPTSESCGTQNLWDAAAFVHATINRVAAIPNKESSHALKRLLENDRLISYHDNLRHAFANQATVRREAEYQQPSWTETVEALKGGAPANNIDLHALVFDQLQIEKKKIRLSNTDTYKSFWGCDSYGKVEKPEIEDICRDRLIEILRPSLVPLKLQVDPEEHMAMDKRADIIVLGTGGMKLPLELKRDFHADIWTACKNQLERMYSRDPDADGYGLYVVFWFGEKRTRKMKKPPAGIQVPESAAELEDALRSLVPSEQSHSIKVIVLDVTPPY